MTVEEKPRIAIQSRVHEGDFTSHTLRLGQVLGWDPGYPMTLHTFWDPEADRLVKYINKRFKEDSRKR